MPEDPSETVVLDRSADVWVGRFPGVGSVRIWPDGRTEVDVESDSGETDDRDESDRVAHMDAKRQALEFGWAEILSLVRRGFVIVQSLAVHDPRRNASLLIGGDLHDTSVAAAALASRGWSFMADRVVPLDMDNGRIRVHPRRAPIVMARRRAQAAELPYRSIRGESNAVAVDVARHGDASDLIGIAFVGSRRPHETQLTVASGHGRFDIARRLIGTGVLVAPDSSIQESMNRTVRLAEIPCVEVRFDGESPDAGIDALTAWWDEL